MILKKGRSQLLRAKTVCIDEYTIETLSSAIDQTISEDAVIVTDKWAAYKKASGERVHIGILSEKGTNMPEIHRLIFNLKNWLRGTHHNTSSNHLQNYLDEFFFRFNYRNIVNSLPNKILKMMTKSDQIPYISLVAQ